MSVTSVTDPELIRPSIPVMTHSLDQKVVTRKAKARKCAAEVAGNVQARVERQHRLLTSFSVIPPSRIIPQRYTVYSVSTLKWGFGVKIKDAMAML